MKFCVDFDDPYHEAYIDSLPSGTVSVGSSNRLGPWLNIASSVYAQTHDIIGFIGDDVIIKTNAWDEDVREVYCENLIAYPNDGWQGEGLPTSVFMDADLIKSLGYMVYPEFTHLYIDNHWKALGEALGTLTYLPEVSMEHMHPFAGKSVDDETYRAANHPDMYSKDGKIFDYYINTILPRDVRQAIL